MGEPRDNVVFLALIEIVAAQILIGLCVTGHMIGRCENGMSHCHQGAFLAPSCGQPTIESGQISVFGARGRPGRLDEGKTQRRIAFGGASRLTFPGAFMVSRR